MSNRAPEPREAHCQCCGGYAGYGADPGYCATCRAAGEHLRTCQMCRERLPRRDFETDDICPGCEERIEALDELADQEGE